MTKTATVMGMPATIIIAEQKPKIKDIDEIFNYFRAVDQRFSPFKSDSELERYNRGELNEADLSPEMKEILRLSDQTKAETNNYFNVRKPDGNLDPSGLVKGWAIAKGAEQLQQRGYRNMYVEIAGDIQVYGRNMSGKKWRIGIRNPRQTDQLLQILELHEGGVATSGTYLQGNHIRRPITEKKPNNLISLTVIASNIYEADRFATAAFAMGDNAISFLETKDGLEGFAVEATGVEHQTDGWKGYCANV